MKKQVATAARNARSLDDTINDLKGKVEELEAALGESDAKGAKSAGEAASNGKALEEAESKLAAAGKAKKALEAALDESKEEAEAEAKAKHDLNLKLKAAIADNEALGETIEEEGLFSFCIHNRFQTFIFTLVHSHQFYPQGKVLFNLTVAWQ